jgi:hypothetical protein
MKLAHVALVSAAVLGLAVVGCGAKNKDDDSDGELGSAESQLVSDNEEAEATEEDSEVGIEESLSGAEPTDPGTPADPAAGDDEVATKMKTNPGKFFRPAGCITSTLANHVITHVFKDCTGPYGLVKFNGTVTTTFVREAGKLTITHEASGFGINGATISGKRVVVYTRNGTVITKTRNGSWSGTTGKGNAFSHEASFVATYDTATKCVTRDGTAKTAVGGRSFERSIEDYKRCGVGSLGCPEDGKIVLTASKQQNSVSVTIEFLGGRKYTVTRPNGTTVTRSLVCRA